MAESIHVAATVMQPTKVGLLARSGLQLKSSQSICKAFGYEPAAARLTCSLQSDLNDLGQKCADATKIAGFALATSALLVSINYLNKALDTFNTAVISPVYFVMFTSLTIIASMIMFKNLVLVIYEDHLRRIFPMSFMFCINIVLGNPESRADQ